VAKARDESREHFLAISGARVQRLELGAVTEAELHG
jgi:hypothetical protein